MSTQLAWLREHAQDTNFPSPSGPYNNPKFSKGVGVIPTPISPLKWDQKCIKRTISKI